MANFTLNNHSLIVLQTQQIRENYIKTHWLIKRTKRVYTCIKWKQECEYGIYRLNLQINNNDSPTNVTKSRSAAKLLRVSASLLELHGASTTHYAQSVQWVCACVCIGFKVCRSTNSKYKQLPTLRTATTKQVWARITRTRAVCHVITVCETRRPPPTTCGGLQRAML